jgi:hypothetical protein
MKKKINKIQFKHNNTQYHLEDGISIGKTVFDHNLVFWKKIEAIAGRHDGHVIINSLTSETFLKIKNFNKAGKPTYRIILLEGMKRNMSVTDNFRKKNEFDNVLNENNNEIRRQVMNNNIEKVNVTDIEEDQILNTQYMAESKNIDDLTKVCSSFGVVPHISNTPGEQQFSISLIDKLCENTQMKKFVFRSLAEEIDNGRKKHFPNRYDEEPPIIEKNDGGYEFLSFSYKNEESLLIDLEKLATSLAELIKEELKVFAMEKNDVIFSKKLSKKEKINKLKSGKYPFIIHNIDATMKSGLAIPAHTHGLNLIKWPEFMIDPFCFGKQMNPIIILATYKYFKKPGRKKILQKILKGETFELPAYKLAEQSDCQEDDLTICFRLAPNTFEGVKSAYDVNGLGVDPDLVVVQIYVKGDDFALTDEYYKDGITW